MHVAAFKNPDNSASYPFSSLDADSLRNSNTEQHAENNQASPCNFLVGIYIRLLETQSKLTSCCKATDCVIMYQHEINV